MRAQGSKTARYSQRTGTFLLQCGTMWAHAINRYPGANNEDHGNDESLHFFIFFRTRFFLSTTSTIDTSGFPLSFPPATDRTGGIRCENERNPLGADPE